MEVSKERFQSMMTQLTSEKTTETSGENWRLTEEIAKKGVSTVYTVVDSKGHHRRKTTNTGGRNRGPERPEVIRDKDKRTHEWHATMRDFPNDKWLRNRENMGDDKEVYTIHGNNGCELWFKLFEEISKMGRIWRLNEQRAHLKITRNEDEYFQLARRFGRYKRMRIDALQALREKRTNEGMQDKFIEWQEAHAQVNKWNTESGYTSEEEERKYRGKKGAAAERKGQNKANGKGMTGKKGKNKRDAMAENRKGRRSY